MVNVELQQFQRIHFSFNASVYTQEELERVSHNYELKESDSTVFCMDYAMNGIGSNSCGPDVMDKYRFDESISVSV